MQQFKTKFLLLLFLLLTTTVKGDEWKLKQDKKLFETLKNIKKVAVVFGIFHRNYTWNENIPYGQLRKKEIADKLGVSIFDKEFKLINYANFKSLIINFLQQQKIEVITNQKFQEFYSEDKIKDLKKFTNELKNYMQTSEAEALIFIELQNMIKEPVEYSTKDIYEYAQIELNFLILTKDGKEHWILKNYKKVINGIVMPGEVGSYSTYYSHERLVLETLYRSFWGKTATSLLKQMIPPGDSSILIISSEELTESLNYGYYQLVPSLWGVFCDIANAVWGKIPIAENSK